jgi:hypothetical protein
LKILPSLLTVLVFSTILAACAALPARDPDIAALEAQEKQALKMAQKEAPEAVLHQIDTNLQWTLFRYTDKAATKEITIQTLAPDMPPELWQVEVIAFSKLVGNHDPGIDLQTLEIGPGRVSQAAAAQWPDCSLRSLTLFPEDGTLTWVALCGTSSGEVSGFMKNDGGNFQTYPNSPNSAPVTATPRP